jgi:hypothetical protein
MAIDKCEHNFSKLASEVLPRYLAKVRDKMKSPTPMSGFAQKGIGVRTLLQRQNLEDDFAGYYVFLEDSIPKYVGISRGVLGRLRQHVYGTTHFDASLAYRIAATRFRHDYTRSDAMLAPEFEPHFQWAQDYLRNLHVAFVEIDNPLELYIFEAYAAMELDTSLWNTFDTH